jgi:uncharacterized membrane protein
VTKGRVEAFSDGVIAILITIMVLELDVPHDTTPSALAPLVPVLLSYALSFVYLGIYWSNHHHLFQAVRHVGGGVLWANLHLLFWLSLIPFTTSWMGENPLAPWPVACYGTVLLMAAIAYSVLVRSLLAIHGDGSTLAVAIGRDRKGMASIALYVAAIALAAVAPWLACAVYVAVAVMWLIPDPRIARALSHGGDDAGGAKPRASP